MDGVDPRAAAQQHLEQMVGRGELTLAEFSDRAEKIWAATCPADLDAALHGLSLSSGQPVPAQPVRRPAVSVEQSRQWAVLGTLKREGRWDLSDGFAATCVFGDIYLDLRDAVVDSHSTRIDLLAIGGDVRILVPPGVTVRVTGSRIMGDLKIDEREYDGRGGPRIDLNVEGGMCGVKVKYLPSGQRVPTSWKWF